MDLVQSRFVTDDVAQLATFYGRLIGTDVVLNDYYVEVATGGLSVAFSKCRFTEIGTTCVARPEVAPRSGESILDFRTPTSTRSIPASTESESNGFYPRPPNHGVIGP